jgi:hypothetical protein
MSNTGRARSDMRGNSSASGNVHTAGSSCFVDADGRVLSLAGWSTADAQIASAISTTADGDAESEVFSESESEVPVFLPTFGEELSSRQYVSLDEQRFLAEQRIMRQKDRHATARFLGMTIPVELRTQAVKVPRVSKKMLEKYRLEQLAKWPFVLPYDEANRRAQLTLDRERSRARNLQASGQEKAAGSNKNPQGA